MSKNFVREINNIKDITKQSYLTNKVNDLLSTKKHNYIRKSTDEYHCLTDNLKTLASSNTSLLSVTNYNDTTNKAMLHPKHDATKEQVLKTTKYTIDITRAPNDSDDKTNIDTNPRKVLEHDKLIAGTNLTKIHEDGTTTTTLKVSDAFNNRVDTLESDVTTLQEKTKRVSGEVAFGNQTVLTSVITVNNFITSLTLSAKQNKYIDLANLNISALGVNLVDNWNGKALTRNPIMQVVYEALDSSQNLVKYNGVALYNISEDKTLHINTTSITSGLLANNLDKVLSVSFL